MKMDKQFPLYGFAAHKGRTGNHASLFMVTGKAIGIQLRGRLLSKPSKKTSGCSCEAHPSRKPSGRGVALPQVTALQLTRLVLLELGKGQNEHRIKSDNTNGDIRLNHCRSTRCSDNVVRVFQYYQVNLFFDQKTHSSRNDAVSRDLQAALVKHGPCVEHRSSFEPIKVHLFSFEYLDII